MAAQLRDNPPTGNVALLLGGSCAREAIVNDASWSDDVAHLGGGHVVTYDLGSRRQTFEQELALVKTLPKIPMIVFIGINRGRFAATYTTTTDTAPPASKPTWVRHHYRVSQVWTLERKRERVQYWLDHRQRLFDQRFATHAEELDRLIQECVSRGYTTVVLALPRNIEAMNGALEQPNSRYLETGRQLAERHGAQFLDFVPDTGLTNADFYDLNHLVGPGRVIYQSWLAYETALLVDGGSPSSKASVEPSPSSASSSALPTSGSASSSSGGSLGRDALWAVALVVLLTGVAGAALRTRVVVRRSRSHKRRARVNPAGADRSGRLVRRSADTPSRSPHQG